MKKAFDFIESLTPLFFELLGHPTIKVQSDYTEVYFDCSAVFHSLDVLQLSGYDELRFFGSDNCITFVFTFYNN